MKLLTGKLTPGWAQPGAHTKRDEPCVLYVGDPDEQGGLWLTIVRDGGKRIYVQIDNPQEFHKAVRREVPQ